MDDIDQEIACAARRAGITIPPERYQAMREAYIGYQQMANVLDQAMPYEAEPAGLFNTAPYAGGHAQ